MRIRPYLFCKYEISSDEDELSTRAQRVFLSEVQGQYIPYRRGSRNEVNAIIMELRDVRYAGPAAQEFKVGYQPGFRLKNTYRAVSDQMQTAVISDDNIKAAHIVMIPHYGCMAIEDRNGELNIPYRSALRAFRSIVRARLEEGEIEVFHLTPEEASRALTEWELIQYDYTIRPLNPIRPSDFSWMRSEAMKKDGAAVDSGRLKPSKGARMDADGGIISETEKVVEAGYGQSGGRAITPEGHEAQVPKPTFHLDKEKNLKEQKKPRFLRIMIEVDEDGDVSSSSIARTLSDFYDV